jgi:carbamate kinase
VVAIGGNALVRRGGPDDVATERANARRAAEALVALSGGGLVVTHGNGPQVGALALGAELAGRAVPLHVLVAESQGHVGHLLQLELADLLGDRPVCTLLTRVVVEPGDPAFAVPSKPIGAVYDEARAAALAAEHGWVVAPDGAGWRRVVASPEPGRVVELEAVRRLVDGGSVVVAGGGGGIPLAEVDGRLEGIDAVIDKDLTSALLAIELDASVLVLLTDVDAVHREWEGLAATPIVEAAAAELRAHRFDPGTMGPKVEAACRFAEATGRVARIGSLDDAAAVAAGAAGTTVRP